MTKMVAKKIESLQHPLVKHWVQLRQERSYREKTQEVLIIGKKMVSELKPALMISTQDFPFDAKEQYLVTEQILKKVTNLNQPDGYAGVLPLPKPQQLGQKNRLLILDQISDPGNLGTVLRSALAFNWEGVILTPGTVDLFNDKALRSAKGATFHLPYDWQPPEE